MISDSASGSSCLPGVALAGSDLGVASTSSAAPFKFSGSSKAKAVEAANESISKDFRRAVNGLHTTARHLLDEDTHFEIRLIHMMLEAETVSAGLMLRRLKSPADTRKIYADWSQWSFMSDFREYPQLLTNPKRLQRLMFTVDISKKQLEKFTSTEHGQIAYEDGRAHCVWAAIKAQLKFRGGSMLWHVWGGPGCTAGFLHESQASQQTTLSFLQQVDAALIWALASGSKKLQDFAEHQGLQSPLMRWLRKAAVLHSPDGVLAPVALAVMQKFWGAILNDKFQEDVLKVMREAETRDSAKKELSHMQSWHCPTKTGELKKYGRDEIDITTHSFVPTTWNVSKVFKTPPPGSPLLDDEEKAEMNLLADVKNQITWHTNTPASEQHRYGELAVLCELYAADDEGKVNSAWKARLMPEGEVVCHKETGRAWFVIRVFHSAALLWPAITRDQGTSYAFDLEVGKLELVGVYELDDYLVARLDAKSWLHQRVLGEKPRGIRLRVVETTSIEIYHVNTAWALVDEATKKLVFEEFSLALPAPDDADMIEDTDITLAVKLTRAWEPTLPMKEYMMRTALATTCPISSPAFDKFDIDSLRESSLEKDVEKTKVNLAEHKAKAEKQKAKAQTREALIRKIFGVPAPLLKPLSKRDDNAVNKRVRSVLAMIAEDADEVLRGLAPEGFKIFTSHSDGRWKITAPTKEQKSVAWTLRGERLGVQRALEWMHETSGVIDCTYRVPLHVQRIIAALKSDK